MDQNATLASILSSFDASEKLKFESSSQNIAVNIISAELTLLIFSMLSSNM